MQNSLILLRNSLREARDKQQRQLYDDREVRQIIDLLLEEVCGLTRVDRIMHPDLKIADEQRTRLVQVAHQLSQGVPVQQALGYAWFHGARFTVTPDVLIPRPETAELIDWILQDYPSGSAHAINDAPSASPVRILDIGTGSGIIAITLARLIHNSTVWACDISTAALSVAFNNACQQGVDNVQFAQIDILAAVDKFSDQQLFNKFSTAYPPPDVENPVDEMPDLSTPCQQLDVIVSNPPYIAHREAAEMSDLVLDHEPSLALFVSDDDPLLFYRVIGHFALRHLSPHGALYFEINAAYGAETRDLLLSLGFTHVELRQDVTGRDRMIKAYLDS